MYQKKKNDVTLSKKLVKYKQKIHWVTLKITIFFTSDLFFTSFIFMLGSFKLYRKLQSRFVDGYILSYVHIYGISNGDTFQLLASGFTGLNNNICKLLTTVMGSRDTVICWPFSLPSRCKYSFTTYLKFEINVLCKLLLLM